MMGSPLAPGAFAGLPLHIPFKREDVEGRLAEFLEDALPEGYASDGPQVFKVHEGEYLVYADGTAQFINKKTGEWGDRFVVAPTMRDVMYESLSSDYAPWRTRGSRS